MNADNAPPFGRLVEAIISSFGWSQKEFAEQLEIQPSTVTHFINGRNNPSYDVLRKIVEKLPALSGDWLLTGKGPMFKPEALSELQSPTRPPSSGQQDSVLFTNVTSQTHGKTGATEDSEEGRRPSEATSGSTVDNSSKTAAPLQSDAPTEPSQSAPNLGDKSQSQAQPSNNHAEALNVNDPPKKSSEGSSTPPQPTSQIPSYVLTDVNSTSPRPAPHAGNPIAEPAGMGTEHKLTDVNNSVGTGISGAAPPVSSSTGASCTAAADPGTEGPATPSHGMRTEGANVTIPRSTNVTTNPQNAPSGPGNCPNDQLLVSLFTDEQPTHITGDQPNHTPAPDVAPSHHGPLQGAHFSASGTSTPPPGLDPLDNSSPQNLPDKSSQRRQKRGGLFSPLPSELSQKPTQAKGSSPDAETANPAPFTAATPNRRLGQSPILEDATQHAGHTSSPTAETHGYNHYNAYNELYPSPNTPADDRFTNVQPQSTQSGLDDALEGSELKGRILRITSLLSSHSSTPPPATQAQREPLYQDQSPRSGYSDPLSGGAVSEPTSTSNSSSMPEVAVQPPPPDSYSGGWMGFAEDAFRSSLYHTQRPQTAPPSTPPAGAQSRYRGDSIHPKNQQKIQTGRNGINQSTISNPELYGLSDGSYQLHQGRGVHVPVAAQSAPHTPLTSTPYGVYSPEQYNYHPVRQVYDPRTHVNPSQYQDVSPTQLSAPDPHHPIQNAPASLATGYFGAVTQPHAYASDAYPQYHDYQNLYYPYQEPSAPSQNGGIPSYPDYPPQPHSGYSSGFVPQQTNNPDYPLRSQTYTNYPKPVSPNIPTASSENYTDY